eukprot:11195876-Lingulodinium_polyedra.AAC.1
MASARAPAAGATGATNGSGQPRISSQRCSVAIARMRSARSSHADLRVSGLLIRKDGPQRAFS